MGDPLVTGPVLVLGASGQLGREFRDAVDRGMASSLSSTWVWADRQACDLARPEQVRAHAADLKPGLIINAAAYTAVDRAESEPDLAQRINADSVHELAQYARRSGAVLVHYSTDYVFNGRSKRPYVESDETDPQSVYGLTKRSGEVAVLSEGGRHLILRTSWVFSRYGTNFLKTMLRLAQERDELRVVADQWGAPTSARLLASQSLQACVQALQADEAQVPPLWGLYHLTCTGQTHWQAYAVHVLQQAANRGVKLRVRPEQVQAITTERYPTPARRPMNSRLDVSLWQRRFGLTLPDWSSEVDQVLVEVLLDQGVLTPAMRDKITSVRSAQ